MPMADAVEIAAREESKAAATRSPDNGIYQIKAAPYRGPVLYTLADYDRDALDALYRDAPPVDPALEALGTLATAANETAHCVPPGMARDELQAAIASAFALLNGGEPWQDDETPAPGYRYRDYPGQGEG